MHRLHHAVRDLSNGSSEFDANKRFDRRRPNRFLLCRPTFRRFGKAEAIRDSLLGISGKLDRTTRRPVRLKTAHRTAGVQPHFRRDTSNYDATRPVDLRPDHSNQPCTGHFFNCSTQRRQQS